ncbi:ribonuclease P 40kDa subunit-domain-containing protein [Lineolata rhizophorae]|uniref:Ribonuclease P 40kDa subunit-domain-containing protein n=1 Tax=Lineolata rhizophorae TaxID=578093 RepID=A0A6A6PAS0_9PEZI|nr:ribonuclease P 40kDa subunit-domain-containing protein [Lineolata rhizophorae]
MLGSGSLVGLPPKCLFTLAKLPAYVDERQPPRRRAPFLTISSHRLVHGVDLIMPEILFDKVSPKLSEKHLSKPYCRVTMSLAEIVESEFLNVYIKNGNARMLSEGQPSRDNVYSLVDGTLHLEMDKATYEQCGLVGEPVEYGGKKHSKARYVVRLNLRLPSMAYGKKGFQRVVWAFKNVLNHHITWLFHDPAVESAENAGPLSKYSPKYTQATPSIQRLQETWIPNITETQMTESIFDQEALLEWISLVALDSPRVTPVDSVDPFISRYQPPGFGRGNRSSATGEWLQGRLVRARWHGFLSSDFVASIWLMTNKMTGEGEWNALNVRTFDGPSYTTLNLGSHHTMTWGSD